MWKQCLTAVENGLHLRSDMKSGDLPKFESTQMTKVWLESMEHVPEYAEYTASEAKSLLELRNGVTCPLIPSLLGVKAKKVIISWFVIQGHDVNPVVRTFNDEQEKVLDTEREGILVVNAGPGTGKTTVANELSMRFLKRRSKNCPGVLLLSYTNSAINENYKRLCEYPGLRGVLGKKDWNKPLNVATSDSLAFFIRGENGVEAHRDIIREALYKLTNRIGLSHMSLPGRGSRYNHVIVDECQDIDEIRGELIMTWAKVSGVKTVTLFGDPRQRLSSRAGHWYSRLWQDSDVPKIGFTKTYRFKSNDQLELVNGLSSLNPRLHVQLESAIPVKSYGVSHQIISCIDEIPSLIRSTSDKLNEWAIIGPSLGKENKTSQTALSISQTLRDSDIPIYTQFEGGFKPNAVFFSTIHSVKGKEFNRVILFGMDRFPTSFPMINSEEGDGLVFVSHSRSRVMTYYIPSHGRSMFNLPRGVGGKIHTPSSTMPKFIRVRESTFDADKDQSFLRFAQVNSMNLTTKEVCSLPFLKSKSFSDAAIKHVVLSILGGQHLRLNINNPSYLKMTEKSVNDLSDSDWSSMCGILFSSPHGRYPFIELASTIKSMWGSGNAMVDLPQGFYMGKTEWVVSEGVVFFSASAMTAHIHRHLLGKSKAFVVNLATGIVSEVISHLPKSRWDYHLNAYKVIKIHVELVNARENRRRERGLFVAERKPGVYQVDTEFTHISHDIFDVALVDEFDPYSSIVRPLFVKDLNFASSWIQMPPETFTDCLDDVRDAIVHDTPHLEHYMSPVDVAWCEKKEVTNIAHRAKIKAQALGSTGSQPPRLGEIYSVLVEPVDLYPHIRLHTALSDALILYELKSYL